MYVGIDIGGTKTLVASFNDEGEIVEHDKFPTPHDYAEFITGLSACVAKLTTKDFIAGGLAMPVTVFDRKRGIGISFNNLPWENVEIHTDIEKLLACPVVVENDAKLACLYEATLLKGRYDKVLYVTISTGIGYALVMDGVIDENAGDAGGRQMLVEHDGKLESWESFASGHAIVERYGKKAMDITDEETWRKIARDLSTGFLELIAVFEPGVIVIGGSVGTYFERYGEFLTDELKRFNLPLVAIPPIIGADKAEEAVVYGCYEIAKQTYGNGQLTS